VELGPEKGFLGADSEGEDIIHPLEPREYRIEGKKRYMNVGRHPGLPNWREKTLQGIKGAMVALADRRFM